jgi:Zn-dependent peptidase ImmA (M78 family)
VITLHRWIEEGELEDPKVLKIREREADQFASALLLPRATFPNEVYTTRLDGFVSLKRRWLVSIQAMIIRCRDLGLIDADQTLNLFKQISFRKWRTREPLDDPKIVQLEQLRLLRRAVELVLEGNRKHPEQIVGDLALNAELLEIFCNLPPQTLATDGGTISPYEPTLK